MIQPSTDSIWIALHQDLFRFIRKRVADDHQAADLLQETFLKVHQRLDSLRESDRVVGWVYQIARNVIRDYFRQPTKRSIPLESVESQTDESDAVERMCRNQTGWLEAMIDALPENYRDAVRLAELEQLSQQEVADRIGISLSGAKSRVQRGRIILKSLLHQCCRFELDSRGNVIDYEPLPERTICRDCDE